MHVMNVLVKILPTVKKILRSNMKSFISFLLGITCTIISMTIAKMIITIPTVIPIFRFIFLISS